MGGGLMSMVMGVLMILLRLVTMVVAGVFVRPMLPKVLVAGSLLMMLLNDVVRRVLWSSSLGYQLYDIDYNLAEGVQLASTVVELLAWVLMLVGLVFYKPRST